MFALVTKTRNFISAALASPVVVTTYGLSLVTESSKKDKLELLGSDSIVSILNTCLGAGVVFSGGDIVLGIFLLTINLNKFYI